MTIVILGAGQAGLQVALTLRQKSYAGDITVVGDEPHLPYQRPPLSKGFLKGEINAAGLAIRQAEALADQHIDFRLGHRADAIDPVRKDVLVAGEAVSYDQLVLALGTRPRSLRIPGADLPGVLSLRCIADGEVLLAALERAADVVIVGGGFIGLEVAATAAAAGKSVTVVEACDRVMARAVAPPVSRWFEAMHASMGTRIHTGVAIESVGGTDRVETVTLADGRVLRADLVLVGIGAVPNTEIAAEAGLDCPNGVAVDEYGRTTDPDIFAAGDCALHPNRFAGRAFRLESVQNAIDQAKTVAGNLMGDMAPYAAVPWFWSDQGAAKLQTTGLPIGTEGHVMRGNPDAGRFTVFHLREGQLLAADSVNSPGDHMVARRLVGRPIHIEPLRLADAAFDLKSLLTTKAD